MRTYAASPALAGLALLISVSVAGAQSRADAFTPLKVDTPPVIDGILDDPVWQQAPNETGFKTWTPDFGVDMSERTIVYYAYDRENLYFAFRCFDSEPDKIKSSVTARDRIRGDDWICINLDSFNDNQSLYALYVNPLGIQEDSRATVVNEDPNVDVVWYSSGRIDEQGWTAEIQIPFKSIRFSYREPVEMGVIFERNISRRSEAGTFPALDPNRGANIPAFLTQTRPLIYTGVQHYRLVEVLPATTWTQNRSYNTGQGRLVSEGDIRTMSLTAKYGISSHLVLDGTVNPDFSQVEADAGQVDFNQRFALFYPEKRPFFLEGRENFIYGGSAAGDPLGAVVHTRTIADPSTGVKLTGKIGDRNTVASIFAVDALPADPGLGERAFFSVLRYKRALSEDSFLGGFYTGREVDSGHNRVVGADGQVRLGQPSLLGFHGFLSQTSEDALAQTDRGHAIGMNYTYNTRDWIVNARLHDLSEDFDTQTGYLTRTGMSRIRLGALRMVYPGSVWLLRIDPMIHSTYIKDHPSDQWESTNAFDVRFMLPRRSTVQLGYVIGNEIFLGERLEITSFRARASSQFTRQLFLSVYVRYGQKIRFVANPYQAEGTDASFAVVYQPTDHFSTSLSYVYSDLYRESDSTREFDYKIVRSRNTYQVNKYLFFRVILEHNSFRHELESDVLASFTYIPGTVMHIGYGSLYRDVRWDGLRIMDSRESRRGFFFKASYLWRM
jgi:hypothetical protein